MTSTTLSGIVDRMPLAQIGPRKLPWDDPAFSRRMLTEHLDQRHDHASRRLETIDAHVEWIFDQLMAGVPGSVLDLGCGPGLYTQRLASRGCSCRGIDFSPASIGHARKVAEASSLSCTYVLGDMVTEDLGSRHDLAIFLFGELNTFPRSQVAELLQRVSAALRPGGILLLEVHTRESVIAAGHEPAGWYASRGGLFAPGPHLLLHEQHWIEDSAVTNTRHFVIDADTGIVTEHGETLTAYSESDYERLLAGAGFVDIQRHDHMGAEPHPDMEIITARRS